MARRRARGEEEVGVPGDGGGQREEGGRRRHGRLRMLRLCGAKWGKPGIRPAIFFQSFFFLFVTGLRG